MNFGVPEDVVFCYLNFIAKTISNSINIHYSRNKVCSLHTFISVNPFLNSPLDLSFFLLLCLYFRSQNTIWKVETMNNNIVKSGIYLVFMNWMKWNRTTFNLYQKIKGNSRSFARTHNTNSTNSIWNENFVLSTFPTSFWFHLRSVGQFRAADSLAQFFPFLSFHSLCLSANAHSTVVAVILFTHFIFCNRPNYVCWYYCCVFFSLYIIFYYENKVIRYFQLIHGP